MKNNRIEIKLKPFYLNETISKIHFTFVVDGIIKELEYPKSGFSGRLVFSKVEELIFKDDLGDIQYKVEEYIYGPLVYNKISFSRNIVGKLIYSYYLYPRVLPKEYRSCPYYDFRNEEYGLTSSGLFSFILPCNEDKFNVDISWDYSNCENDVKGEFTFSNEKTEFFIDELKFCFYIVGKINIITSTNASFYYLKKSEYFDIEKVGNDIVSTYSFMQDYFQDKDTKFKIIIRRDPFEKSGGGTACPYGFISGYSSLATTNLLNWKNVLIHEMVHTWIGMEQPISEYPLTWFNEGMVEYISTFIPYKYGILSKEETLFNINNKSYERYYLNKYRDNSEKEIELIQWQDMTAQMVPYGRGFMYIALVNYQLKKLNRGSIDELLIGRNRYNPLTEEEWISFIKNKLGENAVKEYYSMLKGQLIVPPNDIFEGFKLIEKEEKINNKLVKTYCWKI